MDLVIVLLLLATTPPPTLQVQPGSPADNRQMLTTMIRPAGGAPDTDQTPEFREAMQRIARHDFDAASRGLKLLIAGCEARDRASGKRPVDVATVGEFLEVAAEAGQDVTWTRDACAASYKSAAFLAVEAGDVDAAFRDLDLAARRAPHWALVETERGFLLMRTGRGREALAAYLRASELADRYPSSAPAKPVALRGLGFVYTEMGRLDDARKAYEDSLLVDPGSKVARDELDYIAKLRTRKP